MALEAMQRNGHNLGLGVFECEGLYDTPKLAPVHFDEKTDWISFNCAGTDRKRSVHGVHFFVDDYIFERTWHDPRRYALLLSEFKAAMTPDFSLFTDYPRAVQIYNHYRKHLIGAYWQSMGITVIPSINRARAVGLFWVPTEDTATHPPTGSPSKHHSKLS